VSLQAVKKAKQFEIRKTVRRLKQAEDRGDVDASKLRFHLAAARSTDIEQLAKQAATSVEASLGAALVVPDTRAACDQNKGSQEGNNGAEEIIHRRILGAKCVADEITSILSSMRDVREKMARFASKPQEASATDGEKQANDGAKIAELAKHDSKRNEEEEKEMSETDAAQNALSKLMQHRSVSQLAKNSKPGSVLDHGDSDTSGLLDSIEMETEMSDLSEEYKTLDQENMREESIQDDDADRDKSSDEVILMKGVAEAGAIIKRDEHEQENRHLPKRQLKQKKPPKKPKNRLGQRARRQLAMTTLGKSASMRVSKQRKGGHAAQHQQERSRYRRDENPQQEAKEVLHPSWTARRQQKAKGSISNTAQQAKKIVFSEIDTENHSHGVRKAAGAASVAIEKLHPSWEIKKKAAEKQRHIQPPQGTKIVFDSD